MSATEFAASIGYTAGTFLSLLLTWFPGLNTWHAPLKETPKKLVTLFLVLVVSLFALFGACLKLISWTTCALDMNVFQHGFSSKIFTFSHDSFHSFPHSLSTPSTSS